MADITITATYMVNYGLYKAAGAEGDTETITSIDGTSTWEQKCKLTYQFARNFVLERWPYRECKEYAELTAATVSEQADWDYVFDLPSDCLFVLAQIDEDDHTVNYEFKIRGGKLYTNDYSNTDGDAAYIDYVKLVTDPAEYSHALREAIATKFAAEISRTINPNKTSELIREYEALLQPISEVMAQQEEYVEDDEGEYSWLNGRTS